MGYNYKKPRACSHHLSVTNVNRLRQVYFKQLRDPEGSGDLSYLQYNTLLPFAISTHHQLLFPMCALIYRTIFSGSTLYC